MATDLMASLTDEIAGRLNAWLTAANPDAEPIVLSAPTSKGSTGDLAAPCHRYSRLFRMAPQVIAQHLSEVALSNPVVAQAQAVNGFLNIFLDWSKLGPRVLAWATEDDGALGRTDALAGERVLIEYSAPNTNKPQHLGHARNNLLGNTIAGILSANGADVTRINLINDRGVHICKSMLAYQRFGGGATPESVGLKSDHFVGDYYVRFNIAFEAEYKAAFPDGDGPDKDAFFNEGSELGAATRAMLQAWEAEDPEVRALWRKMNGWCERGFEATYARMGVGFDLVQRESETYAYGKRIIAEGLKAGVFFTLPDGAVAFDLSRVGREGKKIVLRADGTSLYITQDIGTAVTRHEELGFDRLIYVVGSEQDYYFQVLFEVLAELRPELKGRLVHRSYGMISLPEGRMKSREGTSVDADNLMSELRDAALGENRERWSELSEEELTARAEAVGLSGLKYFLLRFNPERSFVFQPETSIQFEGDTGPYCQYAYARICSLLKKLDGADAGQAPDAAVYGEPHTRAVLTAMMAFPAASSRAAAELDPSVLTQALFDLAKAFASFYAAPENKVIDASPARQAALAHIVRGAQRTLGAGLELLGMQALDEM